MDKYPQTGYSWLGVAYERHGEVPLLHPWQKSRLDNDCEAMDGLLYTLENKVHRYHHLCKTYERAVGTKKGEGILTQMEHLKEEIDHLSKKLTKTVGDTIEVMHTKTNH